MDMFCIKDPVVFLTKCQSEGWEVICADSFQEQDKKEEETTTEKNIKKGNNRIVVLGNEGEGVSQDVLDICDKRYWIEDRIQDKTFPNNLIDSLNVSVACGIVLNDLLRHK